MADEVALRLGRSKMSVVAFLRVFTRQLSQLRYYTTTQLHNYISFLKLRKCDV